MNWNRPTTDVFTAVRMTQFAMIVSEEETAAMLRRVYGHRMPGTRLRDLSNEGKLCSIVGCTEMARSCGWCFTHCSVNHRHPRPTGSVCTIEDCTRPPHLRGWCRSHYEKWRRHGDPAWTAPPTVIPSPMEIAAEMTEALDLLIEETKP